MAQMQDTTSAMSEKESERGRVLQGLRAEHAAARAATKDGLEQVSDASAPCRWFRQRLYPRPIFAETRCMLGTAACLPPRCAEGVQLPGKT